MYQALDCSLPSAARSEDLSSIPGPRTNHNKSRIPGGSCHPSTASTSAFQGNDYFQIQVLRCNIQTGDVVFYLIISQIEDSVLTPTIVLFETLPNPSAFLLWNLYTQILSATHSMAKSSGTNEDRQVLQGLNQSSGDFLQGHGFEAVTELKVTRNSGFRVQVSQTEKHLPFIAIRTFLTFFYRLTTKENKG